MTSKLQAALDLAEAGLYVFRLLPNAKVPAFGDWQKNSTRDPAIIRNWWTDDLFGHEMDYNVGVDTEKSGIYVVDVDCKNGKEGKASFETLSTEFGFPPTKVAITPSGGRHHIYRGHGLRNTQGVLGKDIDTRGKGGFIVGAGSAVLDKNAIGEGSYYWSDEYPSEIAELPAWIPEKLSAFRAFTEASQAHKTISEDDEIDIEVARDFLLNHEPAVEGAGGDNHTFITICNLKEIGVSMRTACDLLEEIWNPTCSPPWDHSDLVTKIKSAYRTAQSATGIRSATEFDSIDTCFEQAPPEAPEPPPRITNLFTPLPDYDVSKIPKRQRVFGDLAIKKILSIVVAPPGQGKSTLMLTIAVSKATGRNLLGIDPDGQGNVAVWNNEDDMNELKRRLAAIMQAYNIPMSELKGRLFLNSGEQRKLSIAKRSKEKLIPDDEQAMIDSILASKIEMVIIDPFAETHPAQENSNEEILQVGGMYRRVAQLGNCSIVAVHHTRKLDSASSQGHSGNLDSMRGAGSLAGVARVVVTFNTMNSKQAKLYGINNDQRNRYAVLETAKANLSAPGANFHIFERLAERINATADDPDGEMIGVLKPTTLERCADAPGAPLTDRAQWLWNTIKDSASESAAATLHRSQIRDKFYAYLDTSPSQIDLKAKCEAFRKALEKLEGLGRIKFDRDHIHINPQTSIHVDTCKSTYPHSPP